MRDLLGILIGHIGYVPVFVSDGKEGLEKAFAEKPKLIIMDFVLPGIDGREAIRILRELQQAGVR